MVHPGLPTYYKVEERAIHKEEDAACKPGQIGQLRSVDCPSERGRLTGTAR